MSNFKPVLIIILVVLAIIVLIQINTVNKTNVPAPVPVVQETPSAGGAELPQHYKWPSNAIPSTAEIEKSVKKAEEQRKEIHAIHEQRKQEMIKQAAMPAPEEETIKQSETVSAEKGKSGAASSAYPPDRKPIVFPTLEQRKAMEKRGIVCF